MKDAVIVFTARTPIGKAMRGSFNDLKTPSMTTIAIHAAVERAGIEGAHIEDLVLGTAMQSGISAINPVRLSALAAGLPVSVSGQTVDRQCASGLIAVLQTAERVARQYGISREAQDAYALRSQQRTAAAQAAGLFADEIVPVTARKRLVDKESGRSAIRRSLSPRMKATDPPPRGSIVCSDLRPNRRWRSSAFSSSR
jgi:acetyl-CoA C-acetyltransferase